MVFIGMIFQFNSAQGTGLIMLSNGETKEFSTDDWIDDSNLPKIGLEILYEDSDKLIKIKVPSEEEKSRIKNKSSADKKNVEEVNIDKAEVNEETVSFSTFDEYIQYYQGLGFKLAKDSDTNGSRTASLRSYVMGEFEEIILQQSDSKTTVTKTINGKKVDIH